MANLILGLGDSFIRGSERGHPKEEMQELYGKAVANHLREKI